MDYENLDFSVLLDVISNIANSASATEAEKYTSITTAYVVSNIDANIYKYKVQDQDSVYEASMLSPNDNPYNANDKVYVLHFGDQGKTKKILGLASVVEKEILTQRAKNQYANKLKFIGEPLNFGKGNATIGNLNTFKQELFRQEENSEGVMVQAGGGHLAAAAFVSSTIDKNIKCKYGVRIDFLNNSQVVKTFTFDSTEFVGNIYNLRNSYQQKVFSIENITFTEITVSVDCKGIEKSLIDFNNITLTPVIPAENSSEDYGAIVKNLNENNYITGLKEEDKEFITLEAGLTLWKTEIKPIDREVNSADIIDYFWFRKNDFINYNSLNYCEYGGEGWECLGSRKEIKILEKETDENGAETGNWKEAVKGTEWLEMEPTFKVHKGNAPEFENKYKVVIKYHNMILSSEPYTVVNSSKVPYTATIEDSVYQITTTTEGESGNTVSLTCKVNANSESVIANATYQWYKKRATEDKFDAINTNDTANKQMLVLRPQDIDVVNDFKCYVKFTGNFNGTVSSNTVTVKDLTDLVNKDTYKEEKQVLYQWVEGLKTPELPSNDVDYAIGNLKGWSKTRAAAPNKEGIVYYLNYTERTIIYFQGVLYSKTNWATPEIIANKDSESSALMEQFNTFRALTADGEKQGTFYTDDKELYINADFINTGTLRIGDEKNEIFLATINKNENNTYNPVRIAGFYVDSNKITNNEDEKLATIVLSPEKFVLGDDALKFEKGQITLSDATKDANLAFKLDSLPHEVKQSIQYVDTKEWIDSFIIPLVNGKIVNSSGMDIDTGNRSDIKIYIEDNIYYHIYTNDILISTDINGTPCWFDFVVDEISYTIVHWYGVYQSFTSYPIDVDLNKITNKISFSTKKIIINNKFEVVDYDKNSGYYSSANYLLGALNIEYQYGKIAKLTTNARRLELSCDRGEVVISGTNFSLTEEGILEARRAIIYGDIHAESGTIGGWDITSKGLGKLEGDSYSVMITPDNTYFGEIFTVNADGGTIGGWNIAPDGLSYSEDTYLKPTEGIKVGDIFSASSSGGNIGGWIFTPTVLTNTSSNLASINIYGGNEVIKLGAWSLYENQVAICGRGSVLIAPHSDIFAYYNFRTDSNGRPLLTFNFYDSENHEMITYIANFIEQTST